MEQTILKANERIDDLQRNGLRIIQDPERFCFGMDAVLLSGFANAREGDEVLDMGTGTGILPLLLSAKTAAAHFTALEIQEESADMARRSVSLNHLEEKICVVQGDIRNVKELFGGSVFDVVTCNPPYMIADHGQQSAQDAKAIARHEVLCTFEDVAKGAAAVLKPGGHFYLVHRPFRLAELICTLTKYKLEPKRMRLVYPYVDREPNMVLLEAVRGGRSRMEVEKPLILQNADQSYTEEIKRDYGF